MPNEDPDGWKYVVAFAIVAILFGLMVYLPQRESRADRCSRIFLSELRPPPPKPSEVRWYNENCWEGRPR